MNPNNKGKVIMSREKSIEKDSLIDEWIQKTISNVIPFLGRNFKDSIYKALGKFPTSYAKHIKYIDKRPFLKFDKKTANELDNAFAELYPLLHHELKMIMNELPQDQLHMQNLSNICERNGKSRKSVSMNMASQHILYMVMGDNGSICDYIQILKAPATQAETTIP